MDIGYQIRQFNSFMSRNEVDVFAWIIGIILGTGFGYMLFLIVRAILTFGK
jgi:hypothetical protein